MRTSRTITIAALTMAVSLVAVGCGSGNTDNTDPTRNPSASASSDANGAGGSPGPEIPADWKVATIEVAQLQVPPDWALSSNADLAQTMSAPKDAIGISPGFGTFQANVYRTDGTEEELEELAKLNEKDLSQDLTNFKRLPNETISGSLFFHFRGETEHEWQDYYGTLAPETAHQVTVTWHFNKTDIDRKGAEALIAQIMPTYKVL